MAARCQLRTHALQQTTQKGYAYSADAKGQLVRKLSLIIVVLVGVVLAGPTKARQVLRVGAPPNPNNGSPYSYLDPKSNTMQGVVVDLVTEIARQAGFQVAFEPIQFRALIDALTARKIDLIAFMWITPLRQKKIDFSAPIYSYREGLVVPKSDTHDYQRFEDLKGFRGAAVGVPLAVDYEGTLRGLFAEVVPYSSDKDMLRDVNIGRLKAGFADYSSLAYALRQGLFPEVRLVKSYKATSIQPIAIGARKSDGELLSKIDAAIAKLNADRTMQQIIAKWGLD
jgi:polar amino acid transport system substrate-binding protein